LFYDLGMNHEIFVGGNRGSGSTGELVKERAILREASVEQAVTFPFSGLNSGFVPWA
jgi:hypothetical protein